MKNLLLLLLLAVFMTSCSNELKVKLVNSPSKLRLNDYSNVYVKGDTVIVYRYTNGKYEIINTPYEVTYDDSGFHKAVVLDVD